MAETPAADKPTEAQPFDGRAFYASLPPEAKQFIASLNEVVVKEESAKAAAAAQKDLTEARQELAKRKAWEALDPDTRRSFEEGLDTAGILRDTLRAAGKYDPDTMDDLTPQQLSKHARKLLPQAVVAATGSPAPATDSRLAAIEEAVKKMQTATPEPPKPFQPLVPGSIGGAVREETPMDLIGMDERKFRGDQAKLKEHERKMYALLAQSSELRQGVARLMDRRPEQ